MRNIALGLIETVELVALAVAVSCIFAGIGALMRYAIRPSAAKMVLWLLTQGIFMGVPFGIIGVTSGYMTGASRIGAITAIGPAALTLAGGIVVYLFGKGGRIALMAAFALINFSVMMLAGLEIGGRDRTEADQITNSLEYRRNQVKQMFVLQQFCSSLGLDPNACPPPPAMNGQN